MTFIIQICFYSFCPQAMYHPKLSEEASEYLVREYVEMRKLGASHGQVSSSPSNLRFRIE